MCGSERHTVIAADVGGQAALKKAEELTAKVNKMKNKTKRASKTVAPKAELKPTAVEGLKVA
jgi:hypothetical protein